MKISSIFRGLGVVITLVLLSAVIASAGNQSVRAQTMNQTTLPKSTSSGVTTAVGKALRNQDGNVLVVRDVVVSGDRLIIHYTAKGIHPIEFTQINANPIFAKEGPTLLVVTVNGMALSTIEGTTSGMSQSSTILGEQILRWPGGQPRHFHILVARIMGDTQASFAGDFDLK